VVPETANTSVVVGKTLKAAGEASSRARARVKTSTGNVRSGWPGESGLRRARQSLWEEETEEGSDLGGRLNTNPEERIGPQSKASKSSDSVVAAGMPVSGWGATARGHDPATSRGGCGTGETPER
jgi:hypothetical protein